MSITDADLHNLQHMVGATRRNRRRWGHRNGFAPGGDDIASMERLELAGLARRGRPYYETNYFHATEAGCRAVGMGRVTMKRCMEGN